MRWIVPAAIALVAVVVAEERAWQTGTWHEVRIERPRFSVGVQPRDPNSPLPRSAPAREVRIYVIDTGSLRVEVRLETTVDAPRLDARVGDSVTVALEKNVLYIKDEEGKEHRVAVRKKTTLPSAESK